MPRIIVAYNGVHQVYQLALAAQELGELGVLLLLGLCKSGQVGRGLACMLDSEILRYRWVEGLFATAAYKYPWQFLSHPLRLKLRLAGRRLGADQFSIGKRRVGIAVASDGIGSREDDRKFRSSAFRQNVKLAV